MVSDCTVIVIVTVLLVIKGSPGNPSFKDLQGVNLKDQPGRGTALQYSFVKDTKWLKMYMLLPYPILLHEIHIYQPAGLTQSKYVIMSPNFYAVMYRRSFIN